MTRSKRVIAVATHPIQYQVPWFCALARRAEIDFEVWFLGIPNAQQQGRGFGVAFTWDIPLLDGYRWKQLGDHVVGNDILSGALATRLRDPVTLLRESKCDVLLLTGWLPLPLFQLARAGKRLRIPCLIRGDSNELKPRAAWSRLIHRLLLRHYDGFLAVGKANRDFYVTHGVASERLFPCRHFVDNERFFLAASAQREHRSLLRRSLGVPEDATCFIYAGKLEPKKRILDLLEALRMVSRTPGAPRTHVLVVGTGGLLETARNFAASHALPASFAGFLNQSEIANAYAAADCIVLPSDYGETWGLVVNEAMACGLPAIVSDRVGCGPDLVTDGITGRVFPFGDTAALAGAMVSLATDPSLLAKMGREAQERVRRDYSVESAVEGTIAAIQYVTRPR